jgi:excisionase family DNA binding protein
VPAHIAGDVLRTLMLGLTARVRADGGELSPDVRGLLYALHHAEQTAVLRTDRPGTEQSSASRTSLAGADSVGDAVSVSEAAARLGCSAGYVRRLARAGTIRARRIGARAWAIDPAALEDYRHGGTP